MSLVFRRIFVDEIPQFLETLGTALGLGFGPGYAERFAEFADLDRLQVALDGTQMVATFGAYSLQLTAPGGPLPMAGTTVVTVLPTHRRQGILRRMMHDHLHEAHQRGELLAGLWASEGNIYGRFGYGIASERVRWRIPKPFATLHPHPAATTDGRFQLLDDVEAAQALPGIYEQLVTCRLGLFGRSPRWWQHRFFGDPPVVPPGQGARRHVVFQGSSGAQGYAVYRTRRIDLESALTVVVGEVMATSEAAEYRIWQYLFDIDLVEAIEIWSLPVDHSLRWWLRDIRKVDRWLLDAMWLRVIDVGQALSRRCYGSAGELTLRIHDPLCPWNDGLFRLAVSAEEGAVCESIAPNSTGQDPDLECDVDALGSTFLGGFRWTDLAQAGRVRGSLRGLLLADQLFAWHQAPWTAERF